ncbi:hypothetical protein PWW31_12660 [Vibrio harveyi]|nr:hypothetical protein PWW31_12660 [Vibrio harveyi]
MLDSLTQAQERRILRYVVTVGLATFIALWFNWYFGILYASFDGKIHRR